MGVIDLVESIWNNKSPDWKRYGSRYAKKLEIYNYEHESTIDNEEIYNYEGKYPSCESSWEKLHPVCSPRQLNAKLRPGETKIKPLTNPAGYVFPGI